MDRNRKVVPIKRKVLAKEIKKREERPVCHIANKVLGSAESRVEIVGLDETLFIREELFFSQFVARVSGKNARTNNSYRRIPGLTRHDGGPVKWRLNLTVFTDKAENSQKELLECICRPSSPIVRQLTRADILGKLISAVQMIAPDNTEVLIDEAAFFTRVVIPFARGANPLIMAKKIFGLERATRHPVIKWRFNLSECVDMLSARQITALSKLAGDDWPDSPSLFGADERNRRRASAGR